MKILVAILLIIILLGVQYIIIDKLMSKAVKKSRDYQFEEESDGKLEEKDE